jgi:hypothetical protein
MSKELEVGGKRFIALRGAIEEMGGKVSWDNDRKQASIDLGGKVTMVTMDEARMTFEGQELTLSAAPFVREGALYVPDDFFPGILKFQLPF